MTDQSCPYCSPKVETVLWSDAQARVVLANEPGYPYWCRVIWTAHVKEFSSLSAPDRSRLMDIVASLEAALIAELRPAKMNLASLGTLVPHLHWHVIPRQEDDPSYPDPVWNQPKTPQPIAPDPKVVARIKARVTSDLGASLSPSQSQ